MRYWKEIVLILSVGLLYLNTVKNGFVLDDYSAIVENRFVQSGTDGLPEIFTTHYRKGYWAAPGDLYRPLVLASFALEHQFSPNGVQVHHILNLVFYAVLGLLLFWLLKGWFHTKSDWIPFFIALLFIYHPVHTEVVANIKSRDELLSLFFVIGALLSVSRYAISRNKGFLALTGTSFFLALLSKESSIVFLVVIPMSVFFFYDFKKKDILQIVGVLSVPVILFLVLRTNALANQNEALPISFSFLADNPIQELIKAGYHLSLYVTKLIFPFSLASQYQEFYTGLPLRYQVVGAVSLIAHLALLYYGVKWFIQKKIVGFIILFYLLTTVLHSNIFLTIGTHFGERLLFTPSIAFCILLGIYLVKLTKKKSKRVMVSSLVFILSVYAIQVISRNVEWNSNFSLYQADVQKQPQSAMLNYWYSLELTNENYLQTLNENQKKEALNDALSYLIEANSLKPNYYDAQSQMGLVYYKLGRFNEALPYYEKSLIHGKGNVSTLNNMAAIYFEHKNFKKAKEYYEQAVKVDPYFKDAWGNLGITYVQLNDLNNAARVFAKSIELSPQNARLYFYMGMTLNQMGRNEEAIPYFDKAFEIDPSLRPD